MQLTRARGFSFIELLLAISIGAIIVAMAAPAVESYLDRSRLGQGIGDLVEMSARLREYEKATGALPPTLADAALEAWLQQRGHRSLNRVDPWNRAYQYFNLRTATGNGQARKDKKLAPLNSDFDLYSVGKDGLTQPSLGHANSRDDIVRARDGGFVGTATEFDP